MVLSLEAGLKISVLSYADAAIIRRKKDFTYNLS